MDFGKNMLIMLNKVYLYALCSELYLQHASIIMPVYKEFSNLHHKHIDCNIYKAILLNSFVTFRIRNNQSKIDSTLLNQ